MKLELEADYDLEPEDEAQHARYVKRGMDPNLAWRQVAQDIFGGDGLIIQGAEAVRD